MGKSVEKKEAVPNPAVRRVFKEFWPMFVNSRSLCGYLHENLIGYDSFTPGEFYQASTSYSYVKLKAPLSDQVRNEHIRIAGWMNENFFIRLWAILESHGFTKQIRIDARGSDVVKLLKKLRQHFAHGSGQYDKSKQPHRKLLKDLLKLFPVPGEHEAIPTNIDLVLKPMYERCCEYLEDVLESAV